MRVPSPLQISVIFFYHFYDPNFLTRIVMVIIIVAAALPPL